MHVRGTERIRRPGQRRLRAALRQAASPLALSVGWGLAIGLIVTPAGAADYYWDTDGATAGAGGVTPGGTWSAGGTTLSTDSTGASATGAVTTTSSDRIFFSAGTDATGTYTVTVDGTQNINSVVFQDGTVTLSGGTINFGAVSGFIGGASAGDANTISSVLAGTGGMRFSNGVFTLNGPMANTYTGTTQVGGTGLNQASLVLAASGGNAISGSHLQLGGNNGTSAGFVTLGAADQINDTATVQLNAGHYSGSSIFSLNGFNETIGGINLHKQGAGSSVTFRNGAATDATVTLAGSGTYTTVSGDRTGGRSIVDGSTGKLNVVVALTGAGIQTFGGTDARYTGTTTVTSGTLRLWNTSAWASNAILNGGTLQLHQTSVGVPALLVGAATRTHSQTISGTGGTLRKTGDGTVILTGANTYQGATQIDQGTLRAGSATAFGNNSAVTLANVAGATMDLNNFNITIGSLAGGGTAGGNVTMGSGNLTTGGNDTSTVYGGVISGTGALTKTGTGTQTFSGDNTYTGGTTIAGGTLQLGDGGASGSIVGNVVNNGVLAFNRSDTYTFGGIISGTGGVSQIGPGTTVLTGANTYQGGTLLDAGTLEVSSDANLGDAAGPLIFDGGTLRTTSTFTMARMTTITPADGTFETQAGTVLTQAGAVTGAGALAKSGGGTLTLTNAGNSVGGIDILGGTLDIDGTLQTPTISMADGTALNVDGIVQAAGASPAAMTGSAGVNTVVVGVGGLLRANGGLGDGADVLDVAGMLDAGGGNFDLGDGDDTFVVRDGTVVIGTVVGGAGVDTRVYDIAGVANVGALLEFEGLTKRGAGALNITGPATSELVNVRVEAGVLNVEAGSTVVNQAGQSLNTVILAGATLNVNGSYGCAATADSMDMSGTVGGAGTIDMCGGNDVLTLNDGAALSIDISGGADTDTVILNNANAFTFDAARTDNFEILIKQNSGVATINNSQTFSDHVEIQAGALAVQGTITTPDFRVLAAGTLKGTGSIVGHVDNAGMIAPGNSIGMLTIVGNYTGNGGMLGIETVLGGDASPTDRLVVTGDTAGSTDVKVINLGGAGAQTTEGIKIVDVGGASHGTFTLLGDYVFQGDQAVIAGAYAYRLVQNGISTPSDGDWYLRSTLTIPGDPVPKPLFQPGVPLYEAYAGVLQSFNQLGTLQERVGNRSWSGAPPPQGVAPAGPGAVDGRGIWARIDATHARIDPATSTSGTTYDVTTWRLQAGVDALLAQSKAGTLIGGVTAHYGTISSDISSIFGKGAISAVGYGLGGTLTWYGGGGFYVDAQTELTRYDSDLKSSTLGRALAKGNDGFGYGLSLEAGQRIALRGNWSVTPQAQIAYSSIRFEHFVDQYGTAVSLRNSEGLTGRLGISADYENQWLDAVGRASRLHLYGIANLYYNFLGGSRVDVSGTRLTSEGQALWGGLGLGSTLSWDDGRSSVHGEAFVRTSLHDFGQSSSIGAKLGFSMNW